MSDAILVVLVSFAFLTGSLVGHMLTVGADATKEQAISHGYASYEIVDQKTGKTEFKWKEQGK